MSTDYDVIVLGGGPGGSTLASFVAMQGHRVLLLERDTFPRHQIGESLLPSTVHGICSLLGIKEEVESAGFPRKRGGTFRWGKNPEPWTFTFSRAPNSTTGYAYQVERARFDKMLLDNSRRKGVDVREAHNVDELVMDGERVVGVRFTDANGKRGEARARFVADAGGNTGRFHSHVGQRVHSQFFQNVAVYAYFEGGKRLPPPNQGNILSAAFKSGWFWYIPLSDTLTSVGAVVAKEHADRLREGPEKGFFSFVDECPIIQEYLGNATRVTTGMYGEFRIRKDYSYCNTRFWKPGLVLLGDEACFIDPVFSSGIHLSTYSALLAARSINSCLRDGLDETLAFDEFESRYRREFANFYQFLIGFYDMNQDEDSYFWRARKILNSEERGNDAFVQLVAGLSSREEPLFNGAQGFFDNRAGFGEWFGGMLAQQAEGRVIDGSPGQMANGAQFNPDLFMEGFGQELTQIQTQAVLGSHRAPERPLFAGGLSPSPDGFHWRQGPGPMSPSA